MFLQDARSTTVKKSAFSAHEAWNIEDFLEYKGMNDVNTDIT